MLKYLYIYNNENLPNSKTFFVTAGSKFYQILNKTSQICPILLKLCQSGEISTIWPHCTHSLCRQLIRKFRLGDPFRLDHNEKSIFYFSIERNHSNFGFLLQVLQNVNRNIFTVSVLKKTIILEANRFSEIVMLRHTKSNHLIQTSLFDRKILN